MNGENLPRRVWNRQTKLTYNHWLAALVKGKCSSTKPTCLATGVVCHSDTEQNRPYKIPWLCRGLNRGPTAPQARTLPVCHITPTHFRAQHPYQPSLIPPQLVCTRQLAVNSLSKAISSKRNFHKRISIEGIQSCDLLHHSENHID